MTTTDLHDAFQKYGFIAESDSGEPRIKLYLNPDGTPKGDALVVYVYPQSVNLAVQMMDEAELVYSALPPGKPGPVIKVSVADTTFKKVKTDDDPAAPAADKPKSQLTTEQKQKIEARKRKIEKYVVGLLRHFSACFIPF